MPVRYISVFLAMLAVAACQSSKGDTTSAVDLISKSDGPENADTLAKSNTDGSEAEVAEAVGEKSQNGDVIDSSVKTAKVDGSTPSGKLSNSVASYVAPRDGTVFTWRNNWANLPEIISYKVAGKVKNGDTEYLKLTSVKGFKSTTYAYYLTKDFSLKGYRDKSNKAVMSFKPTEQRYRFPMAPGDKWVTSWKQVDHKTDKITSGGGVVRVIGWETLNLPAGRFKALKVRMPVQRNAPKGLTHYTWFSPKLGVTVKEEIGGGILVWSQILEKVEYP